jgi:hypothetical protein
MTKSSANRFTDKQLQDRAEVLFNSEYVSEEVNQANRVKWLQSVKQLGGKWLLADQVKRKGVK